MSSGTLQSGDLNEFLTDWDVEQLTALTVFPDGWQNVRGEFDVDEPGRFKYPYAMPGAVHAIAPEDLAEVWGATIAETFDEVTTTASAALPWCPRGTSPVPIVAAQGVVLVDVNVPVGYRYWIDGYALDLAPDTTNELNYRWQILVDGVDLLNKGQQYPAPGRPVHAPQKVTIGRDKGQMFLAQQGSRIQVTVNAIGTLAASDEISATIFGQLEGLTQ